MDSAAVDGDVEDAVDEDEGWEMITCFCGKPFAGRPMIECSGNRINTTKFQKNYSIKSVRVHPLDAYFHFEILQVAILGYISNVQD